MDSDIYPGTLAHGLCSGNETSVAETVGNDLLFNFRTRADCHRRFIGWLRDGHFEDIHAAQDLPDPMCFGSMCSLPDGRILLVHCNSEEARAPLTIHLSEDAGCSWSQVITVDALGGYADIAVSGNRIWIFYESQHPGTDYISKLDLVCYNIIV